MNYSNCKSGRWTAKEQSLFLDGLSLFGRNWKKISSLVKTRSPTQVRSHAQKYFLKEASLKLAQKQDKKEPVPTQDKSTQYGEGVYFPNTQFLKI